MSVLLVDPGRGTSLEIDDGALGYCVESVEIGGPEVREVVDSRVLDDGTFDRTRYVGNRSVTITLTAVSGEVDEQSRLALMDLIAPYMHPGRRIEIYFGFDPQRASRMLRCRGSEWSVPWENPGYLNVSFAWVTYGGPYYYSQSEYSVRLGFSGDVTDGRNYYEALITAPAWPVNMMSSDQAAGFEYGSTVASNGPLLGWQRNASPTQLARSTAQARSGTSSLALTRSDGTAGSVQVFPTPWAGQGIVAGNRYAVQCSVYRPAGNGDVSSFSIRVRDTASQVLRNVGLPQPDLGGAWLDVYLELIAQADDLIIPFPNLLIGAGQTAYVDQAQVTDLGRYAFPGRGLLSEQQSSIEAGSTAPTSGGFPGWSASVAATSVRRSTDRSVSGASSLAVSSTTTVCSVRTTADNGSGDLAHLPATPGLYRFSLSAWTDQAGVVIEPCLVAYNAAGAVIAVPTNADRMTSYTVPPNVWSPVVCVVRLPAGTVKVLPYVVTRNAPAGQLTWIDQLSVERVTSTPAYTDPSRGSRGLAVAANLVTPNQASVETDATDFNADAATIARSTEQARVGGASLKVMGTTGSPIVYLRPDNVFSHYVPIPLGTTRVTYMASVYTTASDRTCYLGGQMYDAAGAGTSGYFWGTAYPLKPGWTDLVAYYDIAPTTTWALFSPSPRGGAAGDVYYLDRMGVFEGMVLAGEWAMPGTSGKWGRKYDRVYPAGSTPTQAVCVNAGNVDADWRAVISGPIEGVALANYTTGLALYFPNLVIPGGETVVIDSATHTVLANGEPGSSRYGFIDFARSEWWKLVPGSNRIAISSDTYSAPASTVITWRDAFY